MSILVTDWDETATVLDTTSALATLAASKNSHTLPFAHYSRIYFEVYESYTKQQQPRSTVEEEIDFQKGMKAVELTSIFELEKAKHFANISNSDLAALAATIDLRPGFVDAMKGFTGPKYVLSVNWCKSLIEQVLSFHCITGVQVLANDFEYDAHGVSTGHFDRSSNIRTGYDKMLKLKEIRQNSQGRLLIYVGDSSGDVLPLLSADVGVLIDGGRGLRSLERLARVDSLNKLDIDSSCVYKGTWEELTATRVYE